MWRYLSIVSSLDHNILLTEHFSLTLIGVPNETAMRWLMYGAGMGGERALQCTLVIQKIFNFLSGNLILTGHLLENVILLHLFTPISK